MQETWVWSLVWKDPLRCGATKSIRHNYWACSRAHVLNKEKPVHCNQKVASTHHNDRKACTAAKTQRSQKEINKFIKNKREKAVKKKKRKQNLQTYRKVGRMAVNTYMFTIRFCNLHLLYLSHSQSINSCSFLFKKNYFFAALGLPCFCMDFL